MSIDDDIRSAVKFATSFEKLLSFSDGLVNNERKRVRLEELGFSCIRRRHIREILKTALAND